MYFCNNEAIYRNYTFAVSRLRRNHESIFPIASMSVLQQVSWLPQSQYQLQFSRSPLLEYIESVSTRMVVVPLTVVY